MATVCSIDTIATAQYQKYCNDIIVTKNKSIHDTIKKNSLPLFRLSKEIKKHRNSLQSRETMHLSLDHCTLQISMAFSPMKITFISDFGKIRFSQKSLLSHLDSSGMPNPSEFCQCKILDRAAVVHFLSTDSVKTFTEYADKVLSPSSCNNCSKLAGLTACGMGTFHTASKNLQENTEDMAHVVFPSPDLQSL